LRDYEGIVCCKYPADTTNPADKINIVFISTDLASGMVDYVNGGKLPVPRKVWLVEEKNKGIECVTALQFMGAVLIWH
jgi:hypothetical protein